MMQDDNATITEAMKELKARATLEKKVFTAVCEALLAEGYWLNVDTDDDNNRWAFNHWGTQKLDALVVATFDTDHNAVTDEWYIRVLDNQGVYLGEILCVAGNEGWDLIADHPTSMNDLIDGVVSGFAPDYYDPLDAG